MIDKADLGEQTKIAHALADALERLATAQEKLVLLPDVEAKAVGQSAVQQAPTVLLKSAGSGDAGSGGQGGGGVDKIASNLGFSPLEFSGRDSSGKRVFQAREWVIKNCKLATHKIQSPFTGKEIEVHGWDCSNVGLDVFFPDPASVASSAQTKSSSSSGGETNPSPGASQIQGIDTTHVFDPTGIFAGRSQVGTSSAPSAPPSSDATNRILSQQTELLRAQKDVLEKIERKIGSDSVPSELRRIRGVL